MTCCVCVDSFGFGLVRLWVFVGYFEVVGCRLPGCLGCYDVIMLNCVWVVSVSTLFTFDWCCELVLLCFFDFGLIAATLVL